MKLTQEDLQELTGYKRPSDIEKCSVIQGIRVFFGKGGRIWTTSEAVNGAVKGNAHQAEIVIDGPEA